MLQHNFEFSACTSILVGKKAMADGSTVIGRNEDSKAPGQSIWSFIRARRLLRIRHLFQRTTALRCRLKDSVQIQCHAGVDGRVRSV